jgi:hypothetical protein
MLGIYFWFERESSFSGSPLIRVSILGSFYLIINRFLFIGRKIKLLPHMGGLVDKPNLGIIFLKTPALNKGPRAGSIR